MAVERLLKELTVVNVLIAVVLAVVGVPFGVWMYDMYRFRKCPPGPPTRPFIGNKHLIPASRPWLRMAEWSETYVFMALEGQG
jgi:nitrate reductase NapE component